MTLYDLANKVNSQKCTVSIGGTNLGPLQNARLLISHSEFREPTTSGTVVYYSGSPDNILSGTLLYSSSDFEASGGWKELVTRTSGGEVPLKTVAVTLIGASGSPTEVLTFANCKVSVVDFSKPVEGGVKIDISIVLPDNST